MEEQITELKSILQAIEDNVAANFPDEVEITFHRTERIREIIKHLVDKPN